MSISFIISSRDDSLGPTFSPSLGSAMILHAKRWPPSRSVHILTTEKAPAPSVSPIWYRSRTRASFRSLAAGGVEGFGAEGRRGGGEERGR